MLASLLSLSGVDNSTTLRTWQARQKRILAGRTSAWTYRATVTLSAAVKFAEVLARLASIHTPSCSVAHRKITGFVTRRLYCVALETVIRRCRKDRDARFR